MQIAIPARYSKTKTTSFETMVSATGVQQCLV